MECIFKNNSFMLPASPKCQGFVILLQQLLTAYVYFLCWGLRRASSETREE